MERRDMLRSEESGPDYVDFAKQFDQFFEECNAITAAHFPREAKEFKKPGWFAIEMSYRDNVGLETEENNKISRWMSHLGKKTFINKLDKKSKQALFTTAMIRTIDDFIDDVLWPHIDRYDAEDLRSRFDALLQELLQCVRRYDPDIPDQIIELPILELDLELNASQENFDKNIVRLFDRKSFDIRYIEKLQGLKIDPPDVSEGILKYTGLCISDFSRDFLPEVYENDTDFNLYNYLKEHKINPHELIRFVSNTSGQLKQHQGSENFPQELALQYAISCDEMIEDLTDIWNEHQKL